MTHLDEETMAHTDQRAARLSSGPLAATRLLFLIGRYSSAFREKRALKNLDDRLLEDIGISRADRDAFLKQSWDAPDHWTR